MSLRPPLCTLKHCWGTLRNSRLGRKEFGGRRKNNRERWEETSQRRRKIKKENDNLSLISFTAFFFQVLLQLGRKRASFPHPPSSTDFLMGFLFFQSGVKFLPRRDSNVPVLQAWLDGKFSFSPWQQMTDDDLRIPHTDYFRGKTMSDSCHIHSLSPFTTIFFSLYFVEGHLSQSFFNCDKLSCSFSQLLISCPFVSLSLLWLYQFISW